MRRLIVTLLLLLLTTAGYAENIKVALQIDSQISEGAYSLEESLKIAKDLGFGAIIYTDRDLQRWEYGAPILRKIIKKRVEEPSILSYGPQRYLDDLAALQKKNPDITVIAGTESAPFYFWQGNPLGDDLTMHDWHRHLLAVGLQKADDYRMLPVIGNTSALYGPFAPKKMWPLALIILGLTALLKRRRVIALLILTIGIVATINNYPFRTILFDQYHDFKNLPYQNYIDYIDSRGGLTFWSHIDSDNQSRIGRISFITHAHSGMLASTDGYTGYSALYEGQSVTEPGGLWDRLTGEAIRSLRKQPAWIIAASGLDKERDLPARLSDLQTVVIAPDNSRASILEALRNGRMYIARGKDSLNFELMEYSLTDNLTSAISGATLTTPWPVHLKLKYRMKHSSQQLSVSLIRNGEVIERRTMHTPLELDFQDHAPNRPTYYRIEIEGKDLHVLTNPIFAVPQKRSK